MLNPASMSKVTVAGHKRYMESAIKELHKLEFYINANDADSDNLEYSASTLPQRSSDNQCSRGEDPPS